MNYSKQWLRRLSIWKDYFAVGNSNVKFGLNSTDPTYTQDKEVKNNPDMHFLSVDQGSPDGKWNRNDSDSSKIYDDRRIKMIES